MRISLQRGVAALAGVLWLGAALGQADAIQQTGFVDRVFKDADGKEHKYVLFVPHDYKGDREYPLILFLHGAGEREGGKKMPAEVGIGPAVKKQEKTFPFFVVIPRCGPPPLHNWQATGEDAKRAVAMVDDVQKAYKIDSKRLYLTGLSMGGFGTWSLAAAHPDKWAAIVPVCGRGDAKTAEKIKHIPCWCFHGDADTAVKVDFSREMIKALKEAGGSPRYDEYKGVGHNSWDKAYGTAELYEWLLKQRLK